MALAALCLCMAVQAGDATESLARRVAEARVAYDIDAAQTLRDEARALPETGPEAIRVRVDAALLVAELHRIEWEQIPESDIAKRRPLGQKIDEAAEEALALVDSLPENSERYRLRADLLGTMIRSDFRAKKYRKDMESSAEKAIALDPGNAKAYVSQAKPYLFAEANVGGDPQQAIALLTKALEHDPTLESARCLRAVAYQKAGDDLKARKDWERALAQNPACRPAADELRKLNGGTHQ